jgi:hypothetical protein
MNTFRLGGSQMLQPRLDSTQYFHMLGHVLQNVSTSAWIMDDYAIIPFWPAASDRPTQVEASFDQESTEWEAESLVLRTELECEPLTLQEGPVGMNYTYIYEDTYHLDGPEERVMNLTSQKLSSTSGCVYGFAYNGEDLRYNIGKEVDAFYWSDTASVNIDDFYRSAETFQPINEVLLLNRTEACGDGDVFVFITAAKDGNEYDASGYFCQSNYYQVTLPVTMRPVQGTNVFEFDNSTYVTARTLLDESTVNITAFRATFFAKSWND